ncbi:hypothetical protein F5888DRAFT_1109167 [Russula emetica]|nr:hypothetical protein F5888DRAFT_1109167 [Russula emetica]
MSFHQCQKNFFRRIEQIANEVSNNPAQTRTGHQLSTPYPFTALAPSSFPSHPGTSILMDCHSEGSLTVDNSARRRTSKDIRSGCQGQLIIFDMLPDDVLLEIFDLFLGEDWGKYYKYLELQRLKEWTTLAHVCRRWRSVVFQSPLRLNLRLLCTRKTLARDTLHIWPPLPLIIHDIDPIFDDEFEPSSVDNIIAALEHNDRVCQIRLDFYSSSQLEYVTDSTAMHKPFPELTDFRLKGRFAYNGSGPILPDSFLGGTAPRLRSLDLYDVSFPGLPKLLLSATHLVNLDLYIPRSGYIPPEVMATSLSALTNLESLRLRFTHPTPRPALGSRRPPPPR